MAHGHSHKPIERPPQEHTFHVHKPAMYMNTLLGLLFLMFLTVWASYWRFGDLHLGPVTLHGTLINNVIAMLIAVIKATLVVLFFMGVKFATKLTKMWAIAGFVSFSLMFLVLGDYTTRRYEPTVRWNSDPGSSMQRSVRESRTLSKDTAAETGAAIEGEGEGKVVEHGNE